MRLAQSAMTMFGLAPEANEEEMEGKQQDKQQDKQITDRQFSTKQAKDVSESKVQPQQLSDEYLLGVLTDTEWHIRQQTSALASLRVELQTKLETAEYRIWRRLDALGSGNGTEQVPYKAAERMDSTSGKTCLSDTEGSESAQVTSAAVSTAPTDGENDAKMERYVDLQDIRCQIPDVFQRLDQLETKIAPMQSDQMFELRQRLDDLESLLLRAAPVDEQVKESVMDIKRDMQKADSQRAACEDRMMEMTIRMDNLETKQNLGRFAVNQEGAQQIADSKSLEMQGRQTLQGLVEVRERTDRLETALAEIQNVSMQDTGALPNYQDFQRLLYDLRMRMGVVEKTVTKIASSPQEFAGLQATGLESAGVANTSSIHGRIGNLEKSLAMRLEKIGADRQKASDTIREEVDFKLDNFCTRMEGIEHKLQQLLQSSSHTQISSCLQRFQQSLAEQQETWKQGGIYDSCRNGGDPMQFIERHAMVATINQLTNALTEDSAVVDQIQKSYNSPRRDNLRGTTVSHL